MRDVSQSKNANSSKKDPMAQKSDDKKMSKMSKNAETSKKFDVAKTSESGTNQQSEKSSLTFGGDPRKNAPIDPFQSSIRAATPTPEKKPEVHRTSKGK